MTTMIALVGEQPLPNFLPVRYYDYDNILLVYTQKTQQKYEYLKATLQREVKKINVYGLETDPYDITAIARALKKELDKLAVVVSEPLVFNLTGATKIMSLAAYQVAEQCSSAMIYLQSEGKQTRVYHYIWERQQLRATDNELLSECIKLQDVFNLYFGPGKWQEFGSKRKTKDQKGKLFEEALAATLALHGYEVMVGIRGAGGNIDVDIAIRSGNQYGIIEAKTGSKTTKLEGIQQLHTAAKYLGTYSQTFYVITGESEPGQQELVTVSNIQVISLFNYDGTSHPLAPEDATRLLNSVDKALKG